MKHHGVTLQGISFDTMLAAHLLTPAARSYKLDSLSLEYLNYEMVPIEDVEVISEGLHGLKSHREKFKAPTKIAEAYARLPKMDKEKY